MVRLYAAVDLGTHNCRMLIARPARIGGFRVVQAFSRPVRLGEGLGETGGRLADAAVDRALKALRACSGRIRRAGVRRVRGIATEACRRAANAGTFLERVRATTGLVLEPISPKDEVRLTLAGCSPLLDPAYPYVLLFDIGGGSTEVSWIAQHPDREPEVLSMVSLPYGVVTFAERYGGDRVGVNAYAEMVGTVFDDLAPIEAERRIIHEVRDGRVQMVGTSGTVTTLAAAFLHLNRYDRAKVDGLDLGFRELTQVSAALAGSDFATRAANPCIGPERADLVVAGCAILDAVCRRWPVGRLRVADRGIREGLLMAMIREDRVRAQQRAQLRSGLRKAPAGVIRPLRSDPDRQRDRDRPEPAAETPAREPGGGPDPAGAAAAVPAAARSSR